MKVGGGMEGRELGEGEWAAVCIRPQVRGGKTDTEGS